jgi:hypothetical protein
VFDRVYSSLRNILELPDWKTSSGSEQKLTIVAELFQRASVSGEVDAQVPSPLSPFAETVFPFFLSDELHFSRAHKRRNASKLSEP